MGRRQVREMQGGRLTLEKYHRFFVDPWDTRLTIDHLNHIISMHGFIKLHRQNKDHIMDHLVGQVDLQPPRRSTLHCAAPAAPPSAAVITTAQAEADVDALGWAECPIGCVAAFAAPVGDALETVEPTPRPADFVVAGRRARSKRRRSSAYQRGGASKKVKEEKVQEEEEGKWLAPPSPPPLWMRSPTPPPPPPSPQRPHAVAPPPPAPQCWAQPTLAPLRHPPPSFSSPTVPPPRPQLSWGLPLPTLPPSSCPGAPMFTQHPPPGPPPLWSSLAVPRSYPAPCWGAPSVLPPSPQPQHVPWGWPPPGPPLHWGCIRSPTAPSLHQPPLMQLHQPPPPMLLHQPPPPPPLPPGVCWGRPVF